jgi:hypothetical protein
MKARSGRCTTNGLQKQASGQEFVAYRNGQSANGENRQLNASRQSHSGRRGRGFRALGFLGSLERIASLALFELPQNA